MLFSSLESYIPAVSFCKTVNLILEENIIPMLALPEENRPIGYWGVLRKEYLKKHKSGLYSYLLLIGKLGMIAEKTKRLRTACNLQSNKI